MIHNVIVKVECDRCGAMAEVEPEYKYLDYSGKNGFYDTEDKAVEKKLVKEHQWQVVGAEHICDNCAEETEEQP